MTIDTASFLEACVFASRGIAQRPTLPILSCLHLSTLNGKLTVTGCDLEVWCSKSVPFEGEIQCCADGRKITTFLNNCRADRVTLTHANNVLTLSGGTQRREYDTLPADDYPKTPEVTGKEFDLPSAAMGRVLPAAATDNIRPDIAGVHLCSTAVVATQGKSCHVVYLPLPNISAIIPGRAARILVEESGRLKCDKKIFMARGGDWSVTGKLIEMSYPGWVNHIPGALGGVIKIPDTLHAILSDAVLCSDDGENEFTLRDGRVETKGYSDETGLDKSLRSPIRTNARNFFNALKQAGAGAHLEFHPELHGALKIVNGNFTAVIMPLTPDGSSL